MKEVIHTEEMQAEAAELVREVRFARRLTALAALFVLVAAILLLSACGGGVASGDERGLEYNGELKAELIDSATDHVSIRLTNEDPQFSSVFIVRRVEFDGYAALVEDERVTSKASTGEDGFFIDLPPGASADVDFFLDGKPCTSVVLLNSETLYVEGGTPYQYDDLRLEAHA